MYSSQRMKDWNNITSIYQKNSIYLAEASSLLQRHVTYEIPSLRRQIVKTQQFQNVNSIILNFNYLLLCMYLLIRNVK
jgi:hypothetical protein